jgi:hypothetical protein
VTPEQEEQVRRALASAPPAGSLPPEVAARLEATLAGLVAERSADPGSVAPVEAPAGTAPVVPLEERRRRRWPRLLVAAAAVSVVAYGVGTTLGGFPVSGGGAESTAARDETFAGGGSGAGADTDSLLPEDSPDAPQNSRDDLDVTGSRALAGKILVAGTVRLHSGSLRDDVQRLVADAADARQPAPLTDRSGSIDTLASCEQPDTARGDRIAAARLDGRRATLVLRKASGGTRVAEVYSCGDGSRLLALTRVPSAR